MFSVSDSSPVCRQTAEKYTKGQRIQGSREPERYKREWNERASGKVRGKVFWFFFQLKGLKIGCGEKRASSLARRKMN